MRRETSKWTKVPKLLGAVTLGLAGIGSTLAIAAGSSPAGAVSDSGNYNIVTANPQVDGICRTNAGSLGGTNEEDQTFNYTTSAPSNALPGDTFNLTVQPDVSIFPTSDSGDGVSATLNYSADSIYQYVLSPGLTVNSVSEDTYSGANPTTGGGYYVAPANMPSTVPTNYDPATALPAADLVAIPGTAPTVNWVSSGNYVEVGLLGASGSKIFPGGSAVQVPQITINVTATSAAAGNTVGVLDGGSLPAGSNLAAGAAEPGNVAAPATDSTSVITSTGPPPVWTDSVWTNPQYTNITSATALGIITITAVTGCAPGYESNTDLGTTPPSYYTNGDVNHPASSNPATYNWSPLLTSTEVGPTPGATITTPANNAYYVNGETLNANFACNPGDLTDTVTSCSAADENNNTVNNGDPIDTSAGNDGAHSLTVTETDANGDGPDGGNYVTTSDYTVGPAQAPVANAGPNQTGIQAGATVTLNGSGSTDPNTDGTLSYSWSQLDGDVNPVTLTGANTADPTFVMPADPTQTYPNSYDFALTVTDSLGGGSSTSDVDVQEVATAPSVGTPTLTYAQGQIKAYVGMTEKLGATVTNPSDLALTYAWTQVAGIPTALSNATAANPTYVVPTETTSATTACSSGTTSATANCPTYKVAITSSSGTVTSAAQAAYAATLPTKPTITGGAAQAIAAAPSTVNLSATGAQAQSDPITYTWTQSAGPAVTLTGANTATPSFTSTDNTASSTGQTYTFSVTATDSQLAAVDGNNAAATSTAATVTVTQAAGVIVANASASPTSTPAGATVTLNGSTSTDPDLLPLTYSWTETDANPPVTLSDNNDTTASKPTFVAPPATSGAGNTYTFTLTVSDGGTFAPATSSTVTVTVTASTPTVTVTKSPTTAYVGHTETLGATITDPDGTNPANYTYTWAYAKGYNNNSLSSTSAASPTFTVPLESGSTTTACTSGTTSTTNNCPTYSVTVTNTVTGKSSTSASLAAYAGTLLTKPTASAGSAQNVAVNSLVTLNGSGSAQAQSDPLSYAWTQTAGPTVTLSDNNDTTAVDPTFTAASAPTSYTFSLVVTDTLNPVASGTNEKTSAASTVTVTVAASAPDAPGSVDATAGQESANVTWTAPGFDGGSAVEGYVITADDGVNPPITATGTDPNALSGVISGLTDGDSYTISVAAYNTAGTGASTDADDNPITPLGLPVFSSAASATFTVGQSGTFSVMASAVPAVTGYSEVGALPTGVQFETNGTLTGVPAAGTGGTYPITITATNGAMGTQSFTLSVASPTAVTSITPTSGPGAGGTVVTVHGTALGGSSPQVLFGSVAGTNVSVNAAGTILKATSPAQSASTVDITVTTANGTSLPNTGDRFTYLAPVVTSLSPASGPGAGGTKVKITGTNLKGAISVSFGNTAVAVASTNGNAGTVVYAYSPGGSGAVEVTVTTPGGTSTQSVDFTYLAPTITALAPATGTANGGNTVTVDGADLEGATFTIGGNSASVVSINTGGTIAKVTAPAENDGDAAVNVVATTLAGPSNAYAYAYLAPVVTTVTPTHGTTAGGTTVTVHGANLQGATSVSFGGVDVSVTSADVNAAGTAVTAVSPAHAVGEVQITVTTADGGTSVPSSTGTYTYAS